LIDVETDGVPSIATGDDLAGVDDEEGVSVFPALTNVATSYSVRVTVSNTTGQSATLNGWIDFNKNGVFDAGEIATASVANNATSAKLTWTGLSGLTNGNTYVRFRIASEAAEIANPTGMASNGEVEDFRIAIVDPIQISGTVYDDANGLKDNTVNGTGTNAGGLNAILYDNTNNEVIAIVPIAADGTYSFDGINPGNNYSVLITTNTATPGDATLPAAALPTNWVNTGEYATTGAGNDGTVNGLLPLGIVNTNTSTANFAIEQLPTTDPKIYSISSPAVNSSITLNGTGLVPGPLSGTDNEDGTLGSGNTLVITQAPTQNELYYDGMLVTSGTIITNYDPAKLTIKFTSVGSMSVSFLYVFTDAAGQNDPTPANYTITWAPPLPVVLGNFTAIRQNGLTLLQWNTALEVNLKSFTIQRSVDGSNWVSVGTVNAVGNRASNYTFEDMNTLVAGNYYYRLAMIENNGFTKYSATRLIKIDKAFTVDVYPNPAQQNVYIQSNEYTAIKQAKLTDIKGAVLYTTTDVQKAIPVATLSAGVYIVYIYKTNGETEIRKIIKK
jgi:hypothetical protein